METPQLFTIGHSTLRDDQLIGLLQQHRIQVVADVRTSPLSRYNPQFNLPALRRSLRQASIGYVFMGDTLGGRPTANDLYDTEGHALYGKMAETDTFQAGLRRLLDGSERYRVAILCSEEDPADCHRFLLITRVLHNDGVTVGHIRADGTVQRTETVRTYRDWETNYEQPSLLDGSVVSQWRSAQPIIRR